jgi:S1-C subfamily serine protease
MRWLGVTVAVAIGASALLFSGIAGGGGGVVARVKSGTGFFVSQDGFLVTSAHVVAGCPNLAVWGAADTRERIAHIIASDARRDVSLLWVEGERRHEYATIAPDLPQTGDPVLTLGFGVVAAAPLHGVVVEGTLVGSGTSQSGERLLIIRARLHAGNSGGAVLANNGALVGMVIGRDERNPDVGVAIPNEDLAGLLANYGLGLILGGAPENARDHLSAISALVQCTS